MMTLTKISFVGPGNIRVEFVQPSDRGGYIVEHGQVALYADQAEQAEKYGWRIVPGSENSEKLFGTGLVYVERTFIDHIRSYEAWKADVDVRQHEQRPRSAG